ncbi:hypothetical protein PsYK624_026760 [Phanerochaete sordida]|uniref:Uncharacterized protein n=1 Tax=Phanerochaete sordida TaxID=48140 RepID=A0A9P3G1N5_9APHY|nr:hypothetical protein PsYK624_026760 [Phanerochaete sordida]
MACVGSGERGSEVAISKTERLGGRDRSATSCEPWLDSKMPISGSSRRFSRRQIPVMEGSSTDWAESIALHSSC